MQNKNYKLNIPDDALDLIHLLQDNGYQAFVVGGCTRDALLGKTPHDYDICTNATPEQMKTVFDNSKHKTYDTGIQHGTISVAGKIDKELYEITTYRIDGEYTDGRHPDGVQFVTDVALDLARRDFTINAMAYNHEDGLIDPFNGAKDLEKKLIRCVGDPNKRFQEDGLRIMRAIRFAATYGFDIEPETKKAIHTNKHLLKNVSAERKTSEFIKMLVKADAKLLMEYADVFAEFIPEIKPMIGFDQKSPWHLYDVYEHTARAVEIAPNNPNLRLAVFFHDIGKPHVYQEHLGRGHFRGHADKSCEIVEQVMKRMRFDAASINTVTTLVKHHDDPLSQNNDAVGIKAFLNELGEADLRALVQVQIADQQAQRGTRKELAAKYDSVYQMTFEEKQIYDQLGILEKIDDQITEVINSGEPYRIKDLAINGNDLINLGITPGKDLGNMLNSMVLDVIQDPTLNTRENLLEKAAELWQYIAGENLAPNLDSR